MGKRFWRYAELFTAAPLDTWLSFHGGNILLLKKKKLLVKKLHPEEVAGPHPSRHDWLLESRKKGNEMEGKLMQTAQNCIALMGRPRKCAGEQRQAEHKPGIQEPRLKLRSTSVHASVTFISASFATQGVRD